MFEPPRGEVTSTPIFSRGTDRGRSERIRVSGRKERAVRLFDDQVEVRRGPVPGYGADGPGPWSGSVALAERPAAPGPQQFLWRGRLWQVREVIGHWVEVGAWWLRSPEQAPGSSSLVREREVWRVHAARGRQVGGPEDPGDGVFDLAFDIAAGRWRLAGSWE